MEQLFCPVPSSNRSPTLSSTRSLKKPEVNDKPFPPGLSGITPYTLPIYICNYNYEPHKRG